MMFDVPMQEKLRQPFAPEQIKTRTEKRKRGDGTTFELALSYVSHATITARLNDVFGHHWSNAILHQEVTGKEAIVLFSLTAQNVTHQQFGSARIQNEEGVGDALKAAASDGLRKCASLFGIGLGLWDPDEVAGTEPSGNGQAETSTGATPEDDQLWVATDKQRKFLVDLAGKVGPELRGRCQAALQDAELTTKAASKLIEECRGTVGKSA